MRRYPFILIMLLMLCLSGCQGRAMPSPTPDPTTPPGLLSEREAIDAALKIATTSQPEIEAPQVRPGNIQAKLLTVGDVSEEIDPDSAVATNLTRSAPVWVITMDGEWQSGFPLPTGASTPKPYHHAEVILNAKTGEQLYYATTD